ncbi:hypothetical protein [Actinoplanes sp. NPDC049802]|uniref:hypothetical protein n=1 Tax=Actinoplanes sp. NPDC049802 TaxID=3154742 RepID=UPI0033CFD8F8
MDTDHLIAGTPPVRADTRQPAGARRVGYGVAALIDVVLLVLANGWPGWEAVPFLTAEAADVLPLFNLSVGAAVVVNLVQLVRDPPRLVALGGIVTTGLGMAVLIRLWRVFPFDFGDTSLDWELVTRILLGLGLAGSAIALIVNTVQLVRGRR